MRTSAESQHHADMAMQAARRVARARRRSQKAKMGHVVCHHLLQMLHDDAGAVTPVSTKQGGLPRPAKARLLEDKQFSLSF